MCKDFDGVVLINGEHLTQDALRKYLALEEELRAEKKKQSEQNKRVKELEKKRDGWNSMLVAQLDNGKKVATTGIQATVEQISKSSVSWKGMAMKYGGELGKTEFEIEEDAKSNATVKVSRTAKVSLQ